MKYFKNDILNPDTVLSKNMWKREKIGSTSRIGTDNVVPFMKFEPDTLTRLVTNLIKSSSSKEGILQQCQIS